MEKLGINIDYAPRSVEEPWRRSSCPTIVEAWEKLLVDGWVIVADGNPAIGFDPTFREYVCTTYFGEGGILKPEQYDIFPPDRKRACGLVEATFNGEGEITLRDMPPTSVINNDRGSFKGRRTYEHTTFTGDNRFRHWLTVLSGLIPPPVKHLPDLVLREGGGLDPRVPFDSALMPLSSLVHDVDVNVPFYRTLIGESDELIDADLLRKLSGGGKFLCGVHLFEVERDVVSGPHRDNTRWNAITVFDKQGEGATSRLFDPYTFEPVLAYTLAPGQTLILDDGRVMHDASPMIPGPDGISLRRTGIVTFDFV